MTSPDFERLSTITCPECGAQSREEMPVDACQFFYKCAHCEATLRPLKGDCCVYCSYGSVKCPAEQLEDRGLSIDNLLEVK